MSFNKKLIRTLPLLVTICLILTMIACQTELPMSSEQTNETNVSKVTILKVNDELRTGLKKVFVANKLIGPEGGQIAVGSEADGYSYLKFPQYAIFGADFEPIITEPVQPLSYEDALVPLSDKEVTTSGVKISFYWESESLLQADFYPEGLVFQRPVYVRLSYKNADLTGINEEKLGIYYYNPSSGNWELISKQVNTAENYVEGYLSHFSRYAIGME